MKRYGIIMAGGSGTRFWPLSRRKKPKQFLELNGENTMIKVTMDRLSPVIDKENVFIVTGQDMVDLTKESLGDAVSDSHILAEPSARSTAPCICYAAMEIVKKYGDGVMAIFASDHFIKDEDRFRKVLEEGIGYAEEGNLVTIGIKPTKPETGFGYIKKKSTDSKKVSRFVEKPDLETAVEYYNSGEYLWNSGMFVWKASVILDKFREILPEVYEPVAKIGEAMGTDRERAVIEEIYPDIPRISIDNGIMEKAKDILVLDGDFGWSDVGSLDALEEIWESDDEGNSVWGSSVLQKSTGNIIRSREGKLTALIGVHDLMVIDTKDVLLVCPKSKAQSVKKLLEGMEGGPGEAYL